MFLPYYLLMKEFIHTVPNFSSRVSQVLPVVSIDQDNVYNNGPAEITQIRQIMESAAKTENLLSDVKSKGTPRKS